MTQSSSPSDNSLLRNDFFIKRVSGKFLLNSILAMVFLYAGSLIDTLIVGAFLGEDGLSAMSVVSPVYLVFYTVGSTLGIGASILASRKLGRGQLDEYKKIYTCATISLLIASAVMMILFYAFLDSIILVLSDGKFTEMARSYLVCYIPGGALTMMSYIPLYFLKTDGRPKVSSRLFAMSAVINVILSWLFMSPVCGMGIAGAALATSISMGMVAVVGFIILCTGRSELKFVRGSISGEVLREMTLAGIPNGVSNLLESARIFLINRLLLFAGAASLLSCYTVIRNVSEVLNAVIIGISSAMLPLIGVFFGEHDYESERRVLTHSRKIGIAVMTVLVALVCAFPVHVFRLFGVSDPFVLEEGRTALILSCAGIIVAYVNTLYTGYLTAINREGLATAVVVLRLFAVLAAFAFPLSLLIGPDGIWASLSLAEIVTLIIFLVVRKIIRKRNPGLDRFLLNTGDEGGDDISFSVKNELSDIMNASENIGEFCERNGFDMKKTMRVSLAIEEILTFLISHCTDDDGQNYIDVRVRREEDGVMVRFRYVGEIFDLISFYSDNSGNEEMESDLLGLKLIFGSAKRSDFRQTLGANNLLLVF